MTKLKFLHLDYILMDKKKFKKKKSCRQNLSLECLLNILVYVWATQK